MRFLTFAGVGCIVASVFAAAQPNAAPSNVVLFVPDGLRALAVDATSAPALAAFRDRGVTFSNSHSMMPTVTMSNASAMATGHYLGDTGIFSNTLFSAFPVSQANDSVSPFLENDGAIADVDRHYQGNALNEMTILEAARAAGYNTASIGKLGPVLVFDHANRSGESTILIDDSTGKPGGIPLSEHTKQLLTAAGLPLQPPPRGDNAKQGTSTTPGTLAANVEQQDYFVDVATKAVLPFFKDAGKPFMLIVWSRDPDGTHHYQGDSLNQITPGINGPTSQAAIRNADRDFARLQSALASLTLTATTDVVVAADHGFSTISKGSKTSAAARLTYTDVPAGFLPPGFLAIDLALALKRSVFDPDNKNAPLAPGAFTKRGNGIVASDPRNPDIVVSSNGGSDLVYLPAGDKSLASRVVQILAAEDYVSAIFANEVLGNFPGTLPLSAIDLDGAAVLPKPSFVVGFRTYSSGCAQPLLCAVEVADTTMQQGQGNHGSFSRADTMNFMAAAGPDFKSRFADALPVSNADIGQTMARALKLMLRPKGRLSGRVITEALNGGATPRATSKTMRAPAAMDGVQTVLKFQLVGDTKYFDAAGTVGRTLGLEGVQMPVPKPVTRTSRR